MLLRFIRSGTKKVVWAVMPPFLEPMSEPAKELREPKINREEVIQQSERNGGLVLLALALVVVMTPLVVMLMAVKLPHWYLERQGWDTGPVYAFLDWLGNLVIYCLWLCALPPI